MSQQYGNEITPVMPITPVATMPVKTGKRVASAAKVVCEGPDRDDNLNIFAIPLKWTIAT